MNTAISGPIVKVEFSGGSSAWFKTKYFWDNVWIKSNRVKNKWH